MKIKLHYNEMQEAIAQYIAALFQEDTDIDNSEVEMNWSEEHGFTAEMEVTFPE